MSESPRPRYGPGALALWIALGALPAAGEDGAGLSYLDPRTAESRIVTSLGSSVHIQVTGVIATASVWQIFENPTGERIDALYTFPIPEKVAVDRLEMLIGERRVTGVVRETEEAQRVFARAAAEGRSVSLVRRERSNVFSTSVANLPPRETVEISIGWQQEVLYESGVFSLRLPTVLAARYGAGGVEGPRPPGGLQLGLRIDLDLGIPLAAIDSPTHRIEVDKLGGTGYSIALSADVVPADRDFVLEWRPEPSSEPQVGVFADMVEGEQYVLLLVVPPVTAGPGWRTPREVTFVIDTSGSMAGAALEQAQAALLAALERLGPDDAFNVIRFSSDAEALFPEPARATAGAIEAATSFVGRLVAEGGTEMMAALRRALAGGALDRGLRQVVFITDGRVEGEETLFRYIASHLGRSRLFTVGIGPTPNGYFLRNAARHGRGSYTHVNSAARVRVEIDGLLERLEAPALTDLSIVWPDALADVVPDPIPDLYAGEPLSVTARLLPLDGAAELSGWRGHDRWDARVELPPASLAELRGRRGAQAWSSPIALPASFGEAAIGKLWAARRIEALTDRLITAGIAEAEVRREVTEIALRHQLVSAYTSLVAEDPEAADYAGSAAVWVRVSDDTGSPLGGATIELSGGGAARVEVTGAAGEAHFPGLAEGRWRLRALLDGFSTVEYPAVDVHAGRTTTIELELSSAVEEVITVTSESPLLDERRPASAATLGRIELEKLPTARDPWALLTRAASVTVDRIDLGGSEGGRQWSFGALGASAGDNQLRLDGVEVTDLAAGSAPFGTFDLNQLTELRVEIGGADVTRPAAGVSVDLVTRRGTNRARGSAWLAAAGGGVLPFSETSSPRIAASALAPRQHEFAGNRVDEIEERGLEAGGPVIRDRLWLWGAHGRSDIRNLSGAGTPAQVWPDDTALTTGSLKVNAQPLPDNSVAGWWHHGALSGSGRNASPTRPAPTTWDQDGSTTILGLEDTYVFSSDLFVTAGYSRVDSGLALVSRAVAASGGGAPGAHLDHEGLWRGSFKNGRARLVSEEGRLAGKYFTGGRRVSHELAFGGRLRELESDASFGWPNGNVWSRDIGQGLRPALLISQRGVSSPVVRTYGSGWLQDTMASGHWTLRAGLRYDLQRGRNEAVESAANRWFPTLQPGLSFAGEDAPFEWASVAPRLGLTYAVGEERRLLLRASFARFAGQLQSAAVSRTNPAGPSYLMALWFDSDGSGDFNGSTLEGNGPDRVTPIGARGFDHGDPASPASPNRSDPRLGPETTDEIILGVEYALAPELVAGVSLRRRWISGIHETRALVRDGNGEVRVNGPGDYLLERIVDGVLPDGAPFSVPVYRLDPALTYTGGSLLTNGDRERDYRGLGLDLVKRLSHQWMLRGYLQYGRTEWRVPAGFAAFQSPNLCADSLALGCEGAGGGMIDGGLFAAPSGAPGAGAGAWPQSSWQFNVNGMYQVAPDRPWGFNVAANLFGREGYPLPYVVRAVGADGQPRDLLAVAAIDRLRADDVVTADLRVDKEIRLGRRVECTVGIDVVNVFSERPVLERELDLGRDAAGFVRETLGQRIWLLGVRFEWR